MKNHYLTGAALLSAAVLSCAAVGFPAAAEESDTSTSTSESSEETYTSGSYTYVLNEDGTAALTGYTGEDTDLVIPGELDGHTVTSVQSGSYPFGGNEAFQTVTIPAAMTDLGDSCFFGCSSITQFTVEEGNTVYVAEDGILYSQDGTFLVAYPAGRTDAEFTVKDGIEQIGTGAFGYAQLTSITMPDSVTSINKWSFAYSALTSITFSAETTAIYDYAFAYCTQLKDWTLPDALEYIGNGTFCGCTGMTEIDLPSSLTTIGMAAFAGTGLESITIPSSVTSIGYYAVGYEADLSTPVDNFLIYGVSGSQAETYATETDDEYEDYQNEFIFVAVKDTENSVQDSEELEEEATATQSKDQTETSVKDNSSKNYLIFGIVCGVVLLLGGGALLLTTGRKKKAKPDKAQSKQNADKDSGDRK